MTIAPQAIAYRMGAADAACIHFAAGAYKVYGFARGTEADGHFRATRDELDESSQAIGQEPVALVTCIETHGLAEQATADAHTGGCIIHRHGGTDFMLNGLEMIKTVQELYNRLLSCMATYFSIRWTDLCASP